jgi:hypothetical protein
MPNQERNKYAAKTPWWKRIWKTFVAAIAIAGLIWGVLEVVWVVVKWHDDEVRLEQTVTDQLKTIDSLTVALNNQATQINKINSWIDKKKLSFAVGFRVQKEYDEENERWIYKKMYRDWTGVWREIHLEQYTSELLGYSVYFYVDGDGEKQYVAGYE